MIDNFRLLPLHVVTCIRAPALAKMTSEFDVYICLILRTHSTNMSTCSLYLVRDRFFQIS